MMRKNCNCLYMSNMTIQLEVDMMSKDAKSVAKTRAGIGKGTRKVGVKPAIRPSRRRNTESISGSCEICGSNSWDSDEIRARPHARIAAMLLPRT